jgi:hypothetical protein
VLDRVAGSRSAGRADGAAVTKWSNRAGLGSKKSFCRQSGHDCGDCLTSQVSNNRCFDLDRARSFDPLDRDSSDNAIPSNKHTRLADVSLVWRVRGLGVPRPPLGVKTFILRYLEADVGPLAMRLNWPPSAATPRDRRYRAESGRLHRFGPCFMAGLVLKPGLAGSPARKGRASTAAGARGSLSRAVSSSGQTSPTIPLDVRHDGGAIQGSRAAT